MNNKKFHVIFADSRSMDPSDWFHTSISARNVLEATLLATLRLSGSRIVKVVED